MIGVIPSGSEVTVVNSSVNDLDIATRYVAGTVLPKLYIAVVSSGVILGQVLGAGSLYTANLAVGAGFVLVNEGYILGNGGRGGQGGNLLGKIGDDCGSGQNCGAISNGPYVSGWIGGDGLRLSAQLSSVTIDNTNGNIWGGGGGGGAGGPLGFISEAVTGGGGGEGAGWPSNAIGGGGPAGSFSPTSACIYSFSVYPATAGANNSGATPELRTGGLGGAGANYSSFTSGGGGNGGGWASAGTNAVPQSHDCSAPAIQGYRVGTGGGGAGKAVAPLGAPTIAWLGGSSYPNIKGSIV